MSLAFASFACVFAEVNRLRVGVPIDALVGTVIFDAGMACMILKLLTEKRIPTYRSPLHVFFNLWQGPHAARPFLFLGSDFESDIGVAMKEGSAAGIIAENIEMLRSPNEEL